MKTFVYVGLALLVISLSVVAYQQNEKAEFYRGEKNKMHDELIKVRYEAQSARLEVAKLKQVIELERKNTQEMMQKATKKK
jgi:uncharacterized protein (UPF0335 family)